MMKSPINNKRRRRERKKRKLFLLFFFKHSSTTKVDASVETTSIGLATEPDQLGPCEPVCIQFCFSRKENYFDLFKIGYKRCSRRHRLE